MKITVNGKIREAEPCCSVAAFLASEGMNAPGGMAVAVNGKVVRRPDWDSRILNEGDDIIIISAAYGG